MQPIKITQIYLLGKGTRKLEPDKIIFQAANRFSPVAISSPFSWNANPFSDNNWQSQLQMWRPLEAHLIEYASARNPVWLLEPQKLITDWLAYYRIHAPSRYVWADMTTGMRAMKIAWFIALHYGGMEKLSSSFLNACEDLRKEHLDFLLDTDRQILSNHAFMDLHGAMALAQTLPDPLKASIIDRIHAQFEKLLAFQFGKDGVHRENSPQYQEFALRYLKRMLETGWFATFKLEKIIEKAEHVLSWFRMPDGRLPPIGDTNFDKPCKVEKPEASTFDEEFFNSSGYVVIKPRRDKKEQGSFLFYMGARHSLTHKHSDDLSVFWHEKEDILIDPGKFAYQDSPERQYARSTRAHNTLEVDFCDEYSRGRPRRPRAPLTQIDEVSRKDDIFIIRSSMLIQEHDLTHKRILAYKPDKWLLVADSVFSTRPHDYVFHWHFAPETNIQPEDTGALGRLPSGRLLFINFQSSLPFHSRLAIGERKPAIQGFASSGYGKLVPAPDLLAACNAECWQFASLFSLDERISFSRISSYEYRLGAEGASRIIKMDWMHVNPLY